MAFEPIQAQYDRAKTIFSPDGRLYQVEYAREAVNIGATSLGLIYKNGVIFAARKTMEKLQVSNPEKVFQIDEHIGAATAGLVSDGRVLVDMARLEAQRSRLLYDEPIHVFALAKFVADRKQLYTQWGGVRPFGLSMIIGGISEIPRLFQTDPAGVLKEWKAVAIGRGAQKVNAYFEKKYRQDLNEKEAVQFAIETLKKGEEDMTLDNIEASIIPVDGVFRRITPEELESKYSIKL
jgi:proteasome alpha subunit